MTTPRKTRPNLPTIVVTALLAAAWLLPSGNLASSQEATSWKVHGKLLGGPRKSGGFKSAEDVSGLACDPGGAPRLCLLADDETQGAQIVVLVDGELRSGDFIPLIGDAFEGDPLEFDAEGVAYADGSFYVIGSHGRPRREAGKSEAKNIARAGATRRLFRIALPREALDMETGRIRSAPRITGSSALGEIIKARPELVASFDRALEDNGLTIEGIAARQGHLLVGFRGPVLDDGKAVILEVPISMVLDGQKSDVRLHRLDLGKDTQGNARGVRDLVPHSGGVLVLAGPVNDPADEDYEIRKGDYTVFSWSGTGEKLGGRYDLPGFGSKVKPEAILPLGNHDARFQALVLFDGPDNGRPTSIRIDLQ